MSIKSFLSKIVANVVVKQTKKWSENPIQTQQNVFSQLIKSAQHTAFGKDHHFDKIASYEDFVNYVPVRDYEEINPYIERVVKGESDVLSNGKPLYFAKTSATTSGAKYIPITKESRPGHIDATRNEILHYTTETGY